MTADLPLTGHAPVLDWRNHGALAGCTCGWRKSKDFADGGTAWTYHCLQVLGAGKPTDEGGMPTEEARRAESDQEMPRRVRRVLEEWGAVDDGRHLPASRILGDLRRVLDGDQ